jgi:hydroxymethylpyrimidine pyrophosphatase-like HAD family hydrolase
MGRVDVVKWFIDYQNEHRPDDEPFGNDKWDIENAKISTIYETLEDCPKHLKQYINTNAIIEDKWKDDLYIVYHDNDKICMLENIAELYPIWENKVFEFFAGHPYQDINFTLIEYEP